MYRLTCIRPVTASVFWVTALRVQEFDKGRGPVGFLPIGQACHLPVWPDEGPREGSLVKFRGRPAGAGSPLVVVRDTVQRFRLVAFLRG
jgi:hypothetical protein